jgi:hypothetical protein
MAGVTRFQSPRFTKVSPPIRRATGLTSTARLTNIEITEWTKLDWTLKKAVKSRGWVSVLFRCCLFCSNYVKVQEPGEPEPKYSTTGRSGVAQFSSKEGCNYLDEKEKWPNCVPLAVRRRVRSCKGTVAVEMTSDDNDLAMALSPGSKDLDD